MPARGTGDPLIPLSVLMAIAGDINGFKKKLAELKSQEQAAHSAKEAADESARIASKADVQLNRKQKSLDEHVAGFEKIVEQMNAELDTRGKSLDEQQMTLISRKNKLDAEADRLTHKGHDLDAWERRLKELERTLTRDRRALVAKENALEKNQKELDDRMVQFDNRVSDLNNRLAGFGA